MPHFIIRTTGEIYEGRKPGKYQPHSGAKERRKACKRLGIAYRKNPRIYCFSNVVGGGQGEAFAMAQDGTVLAVHVVKSEGDVCGALGVAKGFAPHYHALYRKHYPDGYDLEFILAENVDTHVGILDALKINHEAVNVANPIAA